MMSETETRCRDSRIHNRRGGTLNRRKRPVKTSPVKIPAQSLRAIAFIVCSVLLGATVGVGAAQAANRDSSGGSGNTIDGALEEAYVLVAGRRLPYLYAISLEAALDPGNNGTANAIIARSKVALDHLDGRLLGDPANLVVSEDARTVYVVNHHGAIDNAEFLQHGGRGAISVLDLARAVDPANDRTGNALLRTMDSGGFGSLGVVLLPDTLVLNNAEGYLTEDGGNRITFVDRRTGSLRHTVELALGAPEHDCPAYPVPHVAPQGPPEGLAVLSPDASWGCFPDPNGLALGRTRDGRKYLFSANGGTGDVSVIDLTRALAGDALAEVARVPVQVGPWGITATPDGHHIIVANGGSQRERRSGSTLSILDVDRASRGAPDSEVTRVLVGTDDPDVQTHPLIPSVTPDGRWVVVPNIRTNNVSIVDLQAAISGDADAEIARISLVRADGRPARPKASAITPDGRYALISGGPRSEPLSEEPGHLYVIDLRARRVVATVTGVGNDPYGVALVYR
jgi:DNA-binding beta-propeller fold protein YncE